MSENNNPEIEINKDIASEKEPNDLPNQRENTPILDKENLKTREQAKGEVKKMAKPLPIEKKPFREFINDHLFPELHNEFQNIGKEVINLNLSYGTSPITGDEKWIIFCEVKKTCSFWLSFESEDITSLKSFCLTKSNQDPSVLESFLIDERKITLKLIISRILQRIKI